MNQSTPKVDSARANLTNYAFGENDFDDIKYGGGAVVFKQRTLTL